MERKNTGSLRLNRQFCVLDKLGRDSWVQTLFNERKQLYKSLLRKRQNAPGKMAACVDVCAPTITGDKGKTAVSAAVQAYTLLDDVFRSDAALVVAKVACSFPARAMRNVLVTFFHTKNEVRNLDVCFAVAVANGWISILQHATIKKAPQCWVFLPVLFHNRVRFANDKQIPSFVERNTHDSWNVVCFARTLWRC